VVKGSVIRRATCSGHWYPGSAAALRDAVETCVERADVPRVEGRIVGAISPHAGYQYSGPVAGYTFRAIKDNSASGHTPDTVVILGSTHRIGFRGTALMDGDALYTPLGQLALDADSAASLAGSGVSIELDYGPHAGGEHSAENQVPFVQSVLPGVPAVIGLIGDHAARTLDDLVEALVELSRTRKVLVVASTDLLHDADYDLVSRTDRRTMEQFAALDHAGVLASWRPAEQVCCGLGPVMVAMRFSQKLGADRGVALHYRNSGDDYPESRGEWVVGYGAAVFCTRTDGAA
jgi:AmmeMemoRadiSam system protein B